MGYQILSTLTGHPALSDFEALPREQIWDRTIVSIEQQLRMKFPDLEDYKVWWKDERNEIWYRNGGTVYRTNYRYNKEGDIQIDWEKAGVLFQTD